MKHDAGSQLIVFPCAVFLHPCTCSARLANIVVAPTCNGSEVPLSHSCQLHGRPQVTHITATRQAGCDGDEPVVQRAVKRLGKAGLQRLQETCMSATAVMKDGFRQLTSPQQPSNSVQVLHASDCTLIACRSPCTRSHYVIERLRHV
jgi:hypothetical protein